MPAPKRTRLTVSRLRDLLHYDKRTGELTWKVNRGRTAKAGDDAGTLRKDGVIVVTIDGKQYMANRLVWFMVTGDWPLYRLTYFDHDPSNLKWANLMAEQETWKATPEAAYGREYRRRRKLLAEGRQPYFISHDPSDPRPAHLRHNQPRPLNPDSDMMHDRRNMTDEDYEAYLARRVEEAKEAAREAWLAESDRKLAQMERTRLLARKRRLRYEERRKNRGNDAQN